MSPERDHEEIEELLAAFALGTTDPEEDALVRAHLDGCATCTSTVQRLRRALGAVPLAADTVSPPQRLRQQILEAAAAARPSEIATPRKARVLASAAARATSAADISTMRYWWAKSY